MAGVTFGQLNSSPSGRIISYSQTSPYASALLFGVKGGNDHLRPFFLANCLKFKNIRPAHHMMLKLRLSFGVVGTMFESGSLSS
jgi:hypothetical protein